MASEKQYKGHHKIRKYKRQERMEQLQKKGGR